MSYAFLNKKVFRWLLKTDSVRLMSRSPRGSEFQKDGPETANILELYPRVLVRGMTKSPRAADRSDRRPETSAAASPIGRMERSHGDIGRPTPQSWIGSFARLEASGACLGCRLRSGRTSFSAWSGAQLHAKLIVACPPEICRLPPGDCCSSRSCWWWRPGPESSRSPLTSLGSISIAGDDSMPSCMHVVRDLSWKAGSRLSHWDHSQSTENLPVHAQRLMEVVEILTSSWRLPSQMNCVFFELSLRRFWVHPALDLGYAWHDFGYHAR